MGFGVGTGLVECWPPPELGGSEDRGALLVAFAARGLYTIGNWPPDWEFLLGDSGSISRGILHKKLIHNAIEE
jgi:hypothetical protein